MALILASSSVSRKALLKRLQIPFSCQSPDFDEVMMDAVNVEEMVRYNTLGKLRSIASQQPEHMVIASDQVAICAQQVLGKPGSIPAAKAQLLAMSGQSVDFYTGVAISNQGKERYAMIPYQVVLRSLTQREVQTYVEADLPLHCAGSFRAEGLGISLFESMHGKDPTALIGLPLIQLSEWLQPLFLLEKQRFMNSSD